MGGAPPSLPDLQRLDPHALRVLVVAQDTQVVRQHEEIFLQHQQLASRDPEIEHLKLLIAKLRRMQFGRKSEKWERQIEQLELRLNELEAARTERTVAWQTTAVSAPAAKAETKPRDGRCRHICHGRRARSRQSRKRARTAAVG